MKNYKKISKGVYQLSNGLYRMRKTIDGIKISEYFTNKSKAIGTYKKLSK